MKTKRQGTFLKDISLISSIFIFLILFLAVLNFLISVRFRAEYQNQDQERTAALAVLCAGYLERVEDPSLRQYLMLNLKAAFDIERFIVAGSDEQTIYDSSMDLPGLSSSEPVNIHQIFRTLPRPGRVVSRGNQCLYHSPEGDYYFYAIFITGYGKLDALFTWHLIYVTISLIFVSFLGFFLIRNLFLPMRYAAGVATRYGIELKREDFVAETFNELLGKMKGQERLLTEFAAYIAHEFRNSIAAIAGHARLAEKGKKESAAAIAAECRDMERLIAGLLEYARPVHLNPVPVDLAALAEDIRTRSQVPSGVMITAAVQPAVAQGDWDLLAAAVANLVRNAVEAVAGSGTVTIETGVADGHPFLAVQDTGPGVDEAERERIFSPFYSRKETGIGLGLALVKKVVEMHNAHIEIESSPGKGSRFVITFPAV